MKALLAVVALVLAICLPVLNAEDTKAPAAEASKFIGTWKRTDDGSTLVITIAGNTATMTYTPGTPDTGTVEQNRITYESTSTFALDLPDGTRKNLDAVDVGRLTLSDDSNTITKERVLTAGELTRATSITYTRVK